MNPCSIESSEYLAFRAALGGELYTASISIHPKITGSWVTTSSFASNSNFFTSSGGEYINNTEVFYFDQVPAGIQNAISQKIKQQNIVLPYSSSDSNIPDANVLSPFVSIQQFPSISSSYTRDIDYVEIGFSPQNEINEDINSQIGYFNLGEVIGDPRFQSSSLDTYPDLDAIRDSYFEKYVSNYQELDYIRLIEFFDNSLFKMLADFVPARTSLASGIIIKNTLLDRNRYRTPQVTTSASIAFIGSGSTNIPYVVEDQTITGSIDVGTTEGSNGGSMPELFGQTSSVYTYPGAVNIDQVWYGSTPSLSGSVPFTSSAQEEFFNGQLSGSNIVVTNGDLSDCNVTLQQIFTVSGIILDGSSPGGEVNYYIPSQYLNVDKTYYFNFTVTANGSNSYSGNIFLNQQSPQRNLFSSPSIAAGGSLTITGLEINNPLNPLFFFIQEALDPGIDTFNFTLNLTIFESYIEPDCLVIQNDAQVNRPNSKYMDVDFTTNAITAVNEQAILSGSATRATVPDSNYTTARIINPRYNGSRSTSAGFNLPATTGSTIGQIPNVEQLTSFFAYTPGGFGNTLATRSGSGNYVIGFLVDEIGTVYKPETSGSPYLPNFIDAFGADSSVVLSPTNNSRLTQPQFTVYKPAVLGETILYSDTGSLGTDHLVSGSYSSLTFNIVPGLYTQPYGLSVINAGSSITAGGVVTASFSSVILDQAQGFNNNVAPINPNTYTIQTTSPVRASLSASFVITNSGGGNATPIISLVENNTPLIVESKTIPGSATATITISSSLFLNSGSVYYFTIDPGVKNITTFGDTWTIVPITGSQTINEPYFTTGSTITSVLTSSAALGVLYGSYQQTPITGSGFNAPPVLSFQPYDEIRFEGNENLVSLVSSASFNQSTGLFHIFLVNPVDTTAIDVNYFAIRRWIPSINNLIINSPGTLIGPGLILPSHPSPLLQQNLSSIVENLINKGLISTT
jgi:hypothetical protein